MTTPSLQVRQLVSATPVWLPAIALALLASLLVPQGADWPAQLFRVELFRQVGFEAWNGQWYSGHPTAGYSVIFPPLGALLGVTAVGIGSVLAATVCFHKLARGIDAPHARIASAVFGLALVPNLIVGRITFGLGLAIGLAALLALQRRRWYLGGPLALLTPLASPVAAVFLAMAICSWAIAAYTSDSRPLAWRLAAVGALTLAPMAVIAVVYPSQGSFGFPTTWIVAVLVASAALYLLARAMGLRALMIGVLIYAVASALVYLIPNPLGGNMWRLAMFFAVPLALLTLPNRLRYLTAAVAVTGLAWAWTPAVQSVSQVHGDPSAAREFHEPLIQRVAAAPGAPGRLEIPFTKNHWEAFYVAAELPIARGWERQADRELNALFYEETLSPTAYREWLDLNAVRWVALPRVGLDAGAETEAALIERRPSWLEPVWSNDNWRLYEVSNATPFVSAPASAVTYEPAAVSFTAPRRGAVHGAGPAQSPLVGHGGHRLRRQSVRRHASGPSARTRSNRTSAGVLSRLGVLSARRPCSPTEGGHGVAARTHFPPFALRWLRERPALRPTSASPATASRSCSMTPRFAVSACSTPVSRSSSAPIFPGEFPRWMTSMRPAARRCRCL